MKNKITGNLYEVASAMLSEKYNRPVAIEYAQTVGGGCINHCYELTTSAGKFFMKQNKAAAFPEMFESERKGLSLLNKAVAGIAPACIACETVHGNCYLMLEWIAAGQPDSGFWEHFATQLSALHHYSQNSYGLDHDNYIGSLRQSNKPNEDWISFFILQRLEPQLKLAIDRGKLHLSMHAKFQQLFGKLSSFFPLEKPALLHGDLWSGNFIAAKNGKVCLVDPAVYYGHREMDLAMMRLFGGFDPSLFEIYESCFPVEKGIAMRTPVQQLYPLLVHVNLFGGHYALEVSNIVQRFA